MMVKSMKGSLDFIRKLNVITNLLFGMNLIPNSNTNKIVLIPLLIKYLYL